MASCVDVPDTQDGVERKRNDQGHHECEVFAGQPGATESARTWSDCVKNPGHARFIPYPDLCLEHLPEGAQTQDVLSRVRSYAARTVRLRVGYTSTHRPDGFPFSNVRGTHLVHTGSGWIDNIPTSNIPPIRRFRVSPRVCMVRRAPGRPCPCPECAARAGNSSPQSVMASNSSPRSLRASNSSPMRKEWYEFRVITACHVVYDKEEAKRTQVDVFYNDESSRVDGTMKTIWGFDVIHVDPENDTCILRCASHDYKIVKEFTPLRMSIFHGASLQRLLSGQVNRDLCVVVSHPHGRPKQVTVGELRRGLTPPGDHKLTYSTSTCPGSSGTPVLCLERNLNPRSELFVPDGVHSLGNVMGANNLGSSYLSVIKG